MPEIRQNPQLAAAANWLALATLAARLVPASRGILIDIGTTTADLIPLDSGHVRPRGAPTRNASRPASLCTRVSGEHPFARSQTSCHCAEFLQAWPPRSLRRRWISTSYWVISSPSPRTARRLMADLRQLRQPRDRLARMVGADRDSFSALDAIAFAQAADECLMARLCEAAHRACAATIGPPAAAVISGSGSFLAKRLAYRLVGLGGPVISLEEAWGAVASSAGCAFALVTLAAEILGVDSAARRSPGAGLIEEDGSA